MTVFSTVYITRLLMGSKLVCSMSIPDHTELQPMTKFTKTWKMKNDGDGAWSESTKVRDDRVGLGTCHRTHMGHRW